MYSFKQIREMHIYISIVVVSIAEQACLQAAAFVKRCRVQEWECIAVQ